MAPTDLELLLQACPPSRPRLQQRIHIPVKVLRRHLRLAAHDGFGQGVVNEDKLFL